MIDNGLQMLDLLVRTVALKVERLHPEARPEKKRSARRRQRIQKKRRENGTNNFMNSKPHPPAVATDDNQPDANSRCPRCRIETGFRWSPRERTHRCCRCRVPLRFTGGQPALNFNRNMDPDIPKGWKIPDTSLLAQDCVRLLGAKLLGGPQPVVRIRAEMKAAGYKTKMVDDAVRFLGIRQKQIERPGPVYFVMPGQKVGNVAKWAIDLMVGVLK